MQYLMGVDGVIVDFVQEITEAVSNTILRKQSEVGDLEGLVEGNQKPQFSQKELSFLLKLIPQLIHP